MDKIMIEDWFKDINKLEKDSFENCSEDFFITELKIIKNNVRITYNAKIAEPTYYVSGKTLKILEWKPKLICKKLFKERYPALFKLIK